MSKGKATWLVVFPFLVLFFSLLAAPARAEEKNLQPVPPEVSTAGPPTVETEIVGFQLKGRYPWELLDILDLDVYVNDEGLRLIPLRRMLKRLEVEYTESDGRLIFTAHGGKPVDFDIVGGAILLGGEPVQARYAVVVSDFTLKEDVYIEPEALAQFLAFASIEWDENEYAFHARTEVTLPMWKVEEGVSLLSIKTKAVEVALPELFPPAIPEKEWASLDFVEVRASAKVNGIDETAGDADFTGLEQTFWGSLMKGRYKLRLHEESQEITDGKLEKSGDPFFTVPHAEWKYEFETSDLLLGDSTYGLNDLIYPSIRLSGLRLNGIMSGNATLGASDYGLRHRFMKPLVFEGLARVGSQVELFINDRLVDSEEVLVDLPDQPGIGRYRFEDVELAPGTINEVNIRITDPDGVVTVVEESLLGTSLLLPKGAFAYLGGLGGNRNADEWGMRGVLGGGRVFYGLSDKATIGLTGAVQDDYYNDLDVFDEEDRNNPEVSQHMGGQIAVQPLNKVMLEGDVAWMSLTGREDDREKGGETRDDVAYYLKANAQPVKNFTLDGQYFVYGPDYFNGNNIDLRDREGYVAGAKYKPFSGITLQGAQAMVNNNVDGQKDGTYEAAARHFEVSTTYVPRSTVTLSRDLLDPDWEEDKDIYTAEINSRPFKKWNVHASHSEGRDLDLDDRSDFFTGLRLPGIYIRETRNTEAAISYQLLTSGSLTGRYRRSRSNEQASLIFSASKLFDQELQSRSEFGWDYDEEMYFFTHRTEYKLPWLGGTRIGVSTEFRREEWSGYLFVAIDEIFDLTRESIRHVSEGGVKPDAGMILGRVFVDADADGVLDDGEPGVQDVEVVLDGISKMTSDEDGYFFFPAASPESGHRLRVNPETVPAIYVCTHCAQGAFCGRGSQTTVVNFGMAPSHSVMGYAHFRDVEHKDAASGLRIVARDKNGEAKAESVTAQDGSFYLGNLMPGTYRLVLDLNSIEPGFEALNPEVDVEVPPALDWQEIEVRDFILVAKPE